jgi:signal recognition particle subunit SRP54
MGDVVSLVEKAQEQYDEDEARKLHKKLAKNQFNLEDFYSQIQQVKKMGNIKDLAGMIPGMDKALRNTEIDNSAFKSVEAIINSMTPFEKENPEVINGSRRKRIADGSGTSVAEVNRLLKQFEQTSKAMHTMATSKFMTNAKK